MEEFTENEKTYLVKLIRYDMNRTKLRSDKFKFKRELYRKIVDYIKVGRDKIKYDNSVKKAAVKSSSLFYRIFGRRCRHSNKAEIGRCYQERYIKYQCVDCNEIFYEGL